MMKCRTVWLSENTPGLRIQMGDEVEVKLVEAAPMAGALRFRHDVGWSERVRACRAADEVPARVLRPVAPGGRPDPDKFGRRRSKGRKR